ncbi:extracellular triacylglycerol lipase [Penicillium brasilianum]|uniref:Extracellular triacylglycerol lipase n=1 Tax=Penicillium brasilianum TaxID=104259 RepID=A0A1S9RKN2_PENBI|nr:extracellular triacylglycerol lipase [Penicillium brasilianum]
MLRLGGLTLWCATYFLLGHTTAQNDTKPISNELFNSLEELSRLVDISYCVGMTGVQKPFQCLSHCAEFPNLELIETWNTGILLSDSCGYIALSHAPGPKRIIIAFRGTYSITNTIIDLSAYPQSYLPYTGDDDDDNNNSTSPLTLHCENCTVHAGFMKSWLNTRPTILPTVLTALQKHPDYEVTLVGHSLGGAVATLAGLEMRLKGWNPLVTTFGAPMVGNAPFAGFLDTVFQVGTSSQDGIENPEIARIRRVTHVDDPVPLLPLREWGYAPHAGEVFISKAALPPTREDVWACTGDEDARCIAGAEASAASLFDVLRDLDVSLDLFDTPVEPCLEEEKEGLEGEGLEVGAQQQVLGKQRGTGGAECVSKAQDETAPLYPRHWNWSLIPARYRLWELFYAHRDYLWRIGLCVPGGDLFG